MRRSKMAVILLAIATSMLAGVAVVNAATNAETPTTSDTEFEASPGINYVEPPELSAAAAGEPCKPSHPVSMKFICTYRYKDYVQMTMMADCTSNGMVKFSENLRSAKNRCNNKSNKLFNGGTLVACMNPGGNRPNPGVYDRMFIPVNYGAQC